MSAAVFHYDRDVSTARKGMISKMAATLEKKEKNTVDFKFEISVEAFEEGMKKSFAKNSKYFNIPGFRKGKAPRKIVEKMYGEEVLYDDAVNFACPEAYDKAVEELALEPVSRPEIDIETLEKGKPVVLKATVTVKPEVTLGEYKGIEIEKKEYNVTAEEIDAEISAMAEKNARMITVDDRAADMGDTANIDFEGFKDGKPFDGGKGENYDLTLGSGQFIPGFEEQVVGMNIGEEKTIDVSFPEDYHVDDLKGAPVQFKVKVNSISKKELPALDDEFAKDVSEFDTFDELKKDITDRLTKAAQDRTKTETENAVLTEAAKNITADIPDCMVDNQLDAIARDYDMRLSQQGLNLAKYLEIMGMTLDKFKENFKEQALEQVRISLMIEAVAKAEGIEISDDEIEEEYKQVAENYKMTVEDIKKYVPASEIKTELTNKKVIAVLVDNCKAKKAKKTASKTTKTAAKKPAAKITKTAAKKTTKAAKEEKTEE